MAAWDALGPFQPGPGGMPPYLAGREAEQTLFRTLLNRLRDRVPLPGEVVLYGPRGNGKTVLLGWLEDEAAAVGAVETLVLSPGSIADVSRISELVLPTSWWDRLTPQEIEVAGLTWRPGAGSGPPPSLEDLLRARVRRRPLLLVMDEAHTLDREVGRVLLNASQRVRRKHPFLLVLAGTPDVRRQLGAMDATFWNRAEKRRIGRLDELATGQALRRPFVAEGVSLPADVVASMSRLSQGYPYFIQLLGQKVWEQMVTSGRQKVTTRVLEKALPAEVDPSFWTGVITIVSAGGVATRSSPRRPIWSPAGSPRTRLGRRSAGHHRERRRLPRSGRSAPSARQPPAAVGADSPGGLVSPGRGPVGL